MNSNTVKIDELKQNNANPSPLTVTFSKTSLSPGGIRDPRTKINKNPKPFEPWNRIRIKKWNTQIDLDRSVHGPGWRSLNPCSLVLIIENLFEWVHNCYFSIWNVKQPEIPVRKLSKTIYSDIFDRDLSFSDAIFISPSFQGSRNPDHMTITNSTAKYTSDISVLSFHGLSFSTYLWWLLIAEKWFFSRLTI